MLANLFNFDPLAQIASILIIFVASIVGIYSSKYLRGDRNKSRFLLLIFAITLSLIITFSADNIFLFAAFWVINNILLVQLMTHNKRWQQSLHSGKLAIKNFTIGFVALSAALFLLYFETNSTSINTIIHNPTISASTITLSCFLIFVTAMTQSALIPFQSWLLSSLNSPTPSSALMHAGLVNGGGLLLARFSELIIQSPHIMTIAFIIGISTAIIGTIWKLIQSNIKSMLACSTMGQMGFMISQCAMGLFPAAIAHLFWHGMFKSYLFLSSASVVQEKRFDLGYPPKISAFLSSLLCGFIGMIIFTKINKIDLTLMETTIFVSALSFIVASQIALIIINNSPIKNFIPALFCSAIASALYALSIELIETNLNAEIFHPLALNIWHVFGLIMLITMWVVRIFFINLGQIKQKFFLKYYVKFLNQSQPNSLTITSSRNKYQN